ncbi:MAG: Type 1 glutamine amidotransferase-like domain-containing protein [Bacillota bacterium]
MSRLKSLFLLAGGRPRDPKTMVSLTARALKECDSPAPRVAYIGTANGDSVPFYLSMKALLREAGAGEVTMVHLAGTGVDLAAAKKALEAADAVYLSGGEVEDGMRWLEHHGLVGLLCDLRVRGKLFLGMSAGSILMGTHWVRWVDPDDDATAELFPCLGFAPTTFDTHAEDEDWKELKTALRLQGPGACGYGIPSGGMAVVDSRGAITSSEKGLLRYMNVGGEVRQL